MDTTAPYADARLVALYDADNPDGPDRDFYRALATEAAAQRILDLGCGTGVLTRTLAGPGRTVIGVDPSAAMLNVAREHSDGVSWIRGDAGDLPGRDADLAIMTGNVAQVFLTDQEWNRTLTCLRQALRPGGILAFESRNPAAAVWRDWANGTRRRRQTEQGPLIKWQENTRECKGIVTYEAHYLFEQTGEHLHWRSGLRFRSAEEIQHTLTESEFELRSTYGDWARGPLSTDTAVMVFIAEAVAGGSRKRVFV